MMGKILTIALFTVLSFSKADAVSCNQILKDSNGPSDLWTGDSSQHDLYVSWHREVTEKAKTLLRIGSLKEVLNVIARERSKLAMTFLLNQIEATEQDRQQVHLLGVYRTDPNLGFYRTPIAVWPVHNNTYDSLLEDSKAFYLKLLQQSFRKLLDQLIGSQNFATHRLLDSNGDQYVDAQVLRTNHYTDYSGDSQEMSKVVKMLSPFGTYSGQQLDVEYMEDDHTKVYLFHPSAFTSQVLLRKTLIILESLKAALDSNSITKEPALKNFKRAMFFYFNAVPFYRGSAAIGRSYFEALYSHFFNEDLQSLPDGVDVFAMIFSEDEFIDWLEI